MGSPGCAAVLETILEAAEFGSKPYPVFFTDSTCTMGQYPPPGETWSEALLNVPGGFDLRAQTCTLEDGVTPAPAFVDDSFPRLPVHTCPVPIIQRMFLPPFYTYNFWAVNAPSTSDHPAVQDPGAVNIDGNSNSIVNGSNFWVLDPSTMNPLPPIPTGQATSGQGVGSSSGSGLAWGSSTGTVGQIDCNFSYDGIVPYSPWFDQRTNLATYTLNSCGTPFWPSMYRVDLPLNMYTDSDGTVCWHIDQGDPSQFSCDGPAGYSAEQFARNFPDLYSCRRNLGPVSFVARDCVWNNATLQGIVNGNPDNGMCVAVGSDIGDDCNCQTQSKLAGSLAKVEVLPKNGWEIQQFRYCVGLEHLVLGGVPVQRYGNSTPACDPLVTSLCQNTAFVSVNSAYAKACSCVLEQQRFNIQFAGLDLPVQCFSSACQNNDPQIYRTVAQSANCTAQLCAQIVTISGSSIAAEGYQTMLCDNTTYVINNTPDVSPGPVPIITPGKTSNVRLGMVFYLALGLLAVMVLLLVAWAVRKWVVNRRLQQQRRQEILQSIEGYIKSTR